MPNLDLLIEAHIVSSMITDAEYFWQKGEPYYSRGEIYPEDKLRERARRLGEQIGQARLTETEASFARRVLT